MNFVENNHATKKHLPTNGMCIIEDNKLCQFLYLIYISAEEEIIK